MAVTLTPEQRVALTNAVNEAVNCKYREQAEKDLRKEITKKVKEEVGIAPRTFNSLVLRKYKNDANQVNEDVTEVLDLAEELGFYKHEDENA